VRFAVTGPIESVGYCHCHRCQRRTGTGWSHNAVVSSEGFEVVEGEDALRAWEPEGGAPKLFCDQCGGAVCARGDRLVVVRVGTLDSDPGVEPTWRQWVESTPSWIQIPDDGVPRFEQRRVVS
jgi:hypothetical protein